MAIKIDLLPAHVALRKRLKGAAVGSALFLALAASALVLLLDAKQKELETAQANRTVYQAVAATSAAADKREKDAIAQAQPVTDTLGFLLAASKTGSQRAALVNQIRQYVYENTVIKSIDLSDGQNVTIDASVTTPEQYAVFLVNLRRASAINGGPLFEDLPRAAGVGGFNNGAVPFVLPARPTDQPVIIPYPLNVTAKGKLKYPVVLPPDPVGAAPAAGAATGGA